MVPPGCIFRGITCDLHCNLFARDELSIKRNGGTIFATMRKVDLSIRLGYFLWGITAFGLIHWIKNKEAENCVMYLKQLPQPHITPIVIVCSFWRYEDLNNTFCEWMFILKISPPFIVLRVWNFLQIFKQVYWLNSSASIWAQWFCNLIIWKCGKYKKELWYQVQWLSNKLTITFPTWN